MKASERPMAKVIDICSKIPGVLDRYTERQQTVFTQIKNCRTEFMGVNVYTCSNSECGHRESRYVSCKNRNCSICSWLPREKWKLQRSNDMIPSTSYYHYVFTIPYELSQICSANKSEVQGLLFRSVAETLKSFEKTHCKNGKIGFIQCLHTWSTRLLEHSHIHVIMPGGYLKDDVWYDMPDYMFPQKALAVKFRGVFCSGLRRLYKKKPFHLPGHLCTLSDPKVWGEFMDSNYKRHWHVHVEPTRGGDPMKLVGYLSNYVYKTAIDHSRIQHVDSEKVVFKCRPRDKSSNEKWESVTLSPEAFLGRFAKHIQPKGFTQIRYYGILGGGVKKKHLATIFAQKGKCEVKVNQDIHRSTCEVILENSGHGDLMLCPHCGSRMLSIWEQIRQREQRGPPLDITENEIAKANRCA